MQQRRKGEWAAELGGGDVLSSGDGMHGTSRYGAGKLRKRETEVGGKSRTGDGSSVSKTLKVVDEGDGCGENTSGMATGFWVSKLFK